MIDQSNSTEIKYDFFKRDVAEVARALIGCRLFTDIAGKRTGGTIIETEAYDQNDPFCHCHKNADASSKKKSRPMFFGPGYVYIYWVAHNQIPCLNFVCNPGSAVLIKALRPICGKKEMYDRRSEYDRLKGIQVAPFEDLEAQNKVLCNGQGKLSEALGINEDHFTRSTAGLTLFDPPFKIIRGEIETPELISGIRVGLDSQLKRWGEKPRGSREEINAAGSNHLRWGAVEHKQYFSTPFNKIWTPIS